MNRDDTSSRFLGSAPGDEHTSHVRTFFEAMRAATPTERIAWLEATLQAAYATGALQPRKMISKEEWDEMGSLPK